MAIKLHFSKISQRRETTITGTLCNRMRINADGMNLTDVRAEVTCKFCLKQLQFLDKVAARQRAA